ADDHGPVAQFGSVALFDRGVEGVAVQVGDVQIAQFVMADHPARGARRAPRDLAVAGPQAVATKGRYGQTRTPFPQLHVNLRLTRPQCTQEGVTARRESE